MVLPTRKSKHLLAYLATPPGQMHARSKLAGLFWPDRDEEQARGSLRNALSALRAAFGAAAVISDQESAGLNASFFTSDVERLETAAKAANQDWRIEDLERLSRPFLESIEIEGEAFIEWVSFERTRCHTLAQRLLRNAAGELAASERTADAIAVAQRLLSLDPLREQNHRLLMQLHAAQGDRSLALAQFQKCKELMRSELGVEPSPETVELARSLSRNTEKVTAAPPRTGRIESSPAHNDESADIIAKAGTHAPPVAKSRQAKARPVIAVLPFDDLGGDPSQQYFGEGISQDIADRLSRYRILSVVGYHSASAMHQRALQLPELRKALGIDYAVTGNIRRSDGRLRVAARLIDARNETTVWAQHYDRPLADILALEDEVSNLIANTLVGQLESEYGMRGSFSEARELTSYELVLQGIWHFKSLSIPGAALAADCFTRAIEANPANAEAHRWLSSCHLNDWLRDFGREKLATGTALARRAVALDPANAKCHTGLSLLLIYGAGTMAAAPVIERAYALNPGDPDVLCDMGLFKAYEGDLAASHAFHLEALRLNPFPPPWYADMRSVTYFAEGRYAEALPAFAALDDYGWDAMYALACHGHLGGRSEALALRAKIEAKYRGMDLRAAAGNEPFTSAEPLHRLQEGLALAYAFA
jgi:TolB-like protein/DNA-binding SARP family transcriptional activator